MADLLTVSHLKKYFSVKGGDEGETTLKAVDDLSFSIAEGETLGLVGESGCGKSTVGKCLVRLYEPTDGQIVFQGTDITHLSTRQIRPLRRNIQMIFQDPYSSLDPRMNVKAQISEGMKIQHLYKTKAEREEAVIKLLHEVGLSEEQMLRYPHEFSGGQRQRIGVARALALDPKLVVCDEPVSALDASGCQRTGAGGESAAKNEGGIPHHLPVHQPRPARGKALERPDRGNVSGRNDGVCWQAVVV